MTPISTEQLLSSLNWRFAVKKFDSVKKIEPEIWAALELALLLSPSSYGLQPWKFFVVETPTVREQLLPHSWGQKQIVDASHLVVFAVKKPIGAEDAEKLANYSETVRGLPTGTLDSYKNMILGSITRTPPADLDVWMSRQIFIALGNFLTSCALLGVDACPMEGFRPEKYDEILGLTARGYAARVVATAGYRHPDDAYASLKKVRYPIGEIVERV